MSKESPVQQDLTGQITPQMRMITYNGGAACWNRSNHLMGAQQLLSSNNSENKCSRSPPRIRIEIMINQTKL
jgi:hypothetical protein